jgi:hypothetical protein
MMMMMQGNCLFKQSSSSLSSSSALNHQKPQSAFSQGQVIIPIVHDLAQTSELHHATPGSPSASTAVWNIGIFQPSIGLVCLSQTPDIHQLRQCLNAVNLSERKQPLSVTGYTWHDY